MIRSEAVELVLSNLNEEDLVVAADGAIAREAYRFKDRLKTFYMLGSMGQVASISLGLALSRSERVIALDGDGNLLMGFGGLALVGGLQPKNLYHIVLDNGCYATTGGQWCLSRQVDLAEAAASTGYRWCGRCDDPDLAEGGVREWLSSEGPAMLCLEVEAQDPNPAPRIPMTPQEMARRFRDSCNSR
jgi:thiamine pyrophosphate-dependent acetolactate synthase large subunit-like protein